MSDPFSYSTRLPLDQQEIRSNCFHPTGRFVEFSKEELEQSIPERFKKIVQTYPHRIAVKSKNHVLTYEELDTLSDRIAHGVLAQHGAEHEPVALLLENDAPMVAAIIGVLKAGKIYVPLDPSFAASTLAFMLKDSQASLLLTNHRNAKLASNITQGGVTALNIDALSDSREDANFGLSCGSDTLAYVIYTSGSTGEPKGVTQSHRNLLQKAMTHINEYHIEPNDRVSLLYSCAFSASARCIFGALLSGAALFPFGVREEGLSGLATWLSREEITLFLSAPTVFRGLASMIDECRKVDSVRLIHLGSEPVLKKDVELFKKHFTKFCVLVNSLASGEAGTTAMYFIGHTTEIEGDVVPVGYAARARSCSCWMSRGLL
jgi:non-ribosomal peptide synthetase component F